ncbi:MAG: EAL domain-containing protein [Sulfurimonadaceae bacterium]
MRPHLNLVLVLIMGIGSVLLTSYYYLHQREYSQQYKTVINAFHTMQNNYDTLSYDILKSALYSYNNQDDISKGMYHLNLDYANLYNAPLFQETQYLTLDYPLIDLGISIAEYNSALEDYLMLNAGIKNSFVFLLNYTESTHDIFPPNAPIYSDINAITSELSNMRRLLDKMHIKTVDEHLQNVQNFETTNDEQRAFIQTLTLHINYIQRNFSAFITVITTLQDKKLTSELTVIQNSFDQIAKNDFIMIDRLAILLLFLIISALVVVVNLLLHSQRENIRLKNLQKELEHIANFDTLTALLNRNSFNHTLSQKQYKKPTLLLININEFKHINDLYGAEVGDYILREVSQLIKLPIFEPYRPKYFHFGGDDFGILLEDIPKKKATSFAEALTQSIKHFIFVDNDIDINITVNIAINSEEPLLENADMVLKYYKKNTAETVVSFSKELKLKEQIQNNIDVLKSLAKAIEQKRIIPYFQPIIDLGSGQIVKYEALVRQIATDGTIIGPDQFLELAAQTPLYRELTKVMIEHVFATFADKPYRFSINLSMRDLLDSELMLMLEDQLKANPQSAKRLEIELLESENLFDIQATERFITLLKSYGCRIAIDDFGTGYSNFSYLAKLSVDTLKIDGSLVSKIETDEKYLKTVQTIVHYAKTLGVETVAEFVETKETALKLREIGVTYGQGYYFDKPQATVTQKEIIL